MSPQALATYMATSLTSIPSQSDETDEIPTQWNICFSQREAFQILLPIITFLHSHRMKNAAAHPLQPHPTSH